MVCIYCAQETRVTNSRHQVRSNRVWRRRNCLACGTTFTSLESVDLNGSITVKSREQLQPFRRDKLFISIFSSLQHRKTAQEDATALTDTVLNRLQPYMKEVVMQKHVIVRITAECLRRFDSVAATYYKVFHPAGADED